MTKNKVMKTVLTFVLLFAVSISYAETPVNPNEENDPAGDENLNPAAPISDYLLPMLIIGVATAFILLRTKTRQEVS